MTARRPTGVLTAVLVAAGAIALAMSAAAMTGQVVDAASGLPVAGATVTLGDDVVLTDAGGIFSVPDDGAAALLRLRAPGYARRDLPLEAARSAGLGQVALTPFAPKALYLSPFGMSNRRLRDAALEVIERTELNAVVVDIKGDRGLVLHRSGVPLAAEVGAEKTGFVGDLPALVAALKARDLYLIARIVVFKDDPFARSHPELAVRTEAGAVWHDREGLAWIDPFRRQAWTYSLDLAVEAAASGFDEIQFDYLRFPDARGLVYAEPNTQANRVGAILDFLAQARRRLAPYNVFTAVDIFGYVCWNTNDTFIGQDLERLPGVVDYISPMLYPSGFQFGIPGHPDAVSHPFDIVQDTLERAKTRTGIPGVRFRPWLQSFKDYAFDRRRFGADEIAAQIRAAEGSHTDGWMLWNPQNVYSEAGLRSD